MYHLVLERVYKPMSLWQLRWPHLNITCCRTLGAVNEIFLCICLPVYTTQLTNLLESYFLKSFHFWTYCKLRHNCRSWYWPNNQSFPQQYCHFNQDYLDLVADGDGHILLRQTEFVYDYLRSKDKAEKWYDVSRHIQLHLSKYKKWRYPIHCDKPTAQLLFKSQFPKGGPTCRRQMVNPRHQMPQGQSVAKPEEYPSWVARCDIKESVESNIYQSKFASICISTNKAVVKHPKL